ncbi:MAG: permease [Proteobacteria bacterium]|nr:permease [Pseudomonadota bacterium]MBU1583943.1 permease [Pseudomonadota bacterium]MBU2454965.1 permease [Pseudomonadota bacterium]MBU2629501.1 permease [Pseudomonadota bacterium]
MLLGGFFFIILISGFLGFDPGRQVGQNFLTFAVSMLKLLPLAFLMIGLFEVWIKSETVEKHLGKASGVIGHLWAIVLAGMVVGPLYVALPVANALREKGAGTGVIFTYLGASAVCRVPMAIFETSFLGIKFTAIRFLVSLPLILMTSIILERYLEQNSDTIMKQENEQSTK